MLINLLLCLASVVMLCLPWAGTTGYFLLGALVPLLILQQRLEDRSRLTGKKHRIFFYVAGTFLLWNFISIIWLLWLRGFAAVAFTAAVLVNTFMTVVPFMVYHYVWRRAKKPLAYTMLVAMWIAFEYLYLHGEISFPWMTLGNGFMNDVKAVQWYEYTGVLGGSLWVLVANIVIYEAIKNYRAAKQISAFVTPVLVVAVPLVVSVFMYNKYTEVENPVTVEVIQPNIDPYEEKFDSMTEEEQVDIMLSLAPNAPQGVDYIVTPETSLASSFHWEDRFESNATLARFRGFLYENAPAAKFIIGANTLKRYPNTAEKSITARYGRGGIWYDVYNSAVYIDTTSFVDVYHKSKLVIGAETMPYYKQMKKLEKLSLDLGGLTGLLGTENERSVFTSQDGAKVGVAICYESVYGQYCAEYVQKGAQSLFIITNDGWWGNTAGHRNHFAFARLRAIELRRSIARSANTGISGFINQRGDVISKTKWDERVSQTGVINLNDKLTFYARFGDMTGRLAVYAALLGVLYYIAYRRRKKDYLTD